VLNKEGKKSSESIDSVNRTFNKSDSEKKKKMNENHSLLLSQ